MQLRTGYFNCMGSSCCWGKQVLTAPWNCYISCFFLVCLLQQKFQNPRQQTQLLQEATLISLKPAAVLAWVPERSDSLPVILGWWNTAIVFLRLLSSQFLCFCASLVLNGPITAISSGRSWWVQWCGKVHMTVPFFVPSSATPSVPWLLLLSRRTSMAYPWLQGVFLLMCSDTFKIEDPSSSHLLGNLSYRDFLLVHRSLVHHAF